MGRQAVRSCTLELKNVAGKDVTTIEGLERTASYIPCRKPLSITTPFSAGIAPRA